MVALSPTLNVSTPSPKNSINEPTTLFFLSSSVIFKTKSVEVIPSLSLLVKLTPTTSGSVIGNGFPSIEISASTPPTPQPKTPIAFIMGV